MYQVDSEYFLFFYFTLEGDVTSPFTLGAGRYDAFRIIRLGRRNISPRHHRNP